MPSGNGARAKQKRERNAEKAAASSSAKSQLKTNEKAMNILCKICRQTWLCTTKEAELKQHAESRHPKNTYADCFDA